MWQLSFEYYTLGQSGKFEISGDDFIFVFWLEMDKNHIFYSHGHHTYFSFKNLISRTPLTFIVEESFFLEFPTICCKLSKKNHQS